MTTFSHSLFTQKHSILHAWRGSEYVCVQIAPGNFLCHHKKHLMGYFKFLHGSRIICLPLNIWEKLHWQLLFWKARKGRDSSTCRTTSAIKTNGDHQHFFIRTSISLFCTFYENHLSLAKSSPRIWTHLFSIGRFITNKQIETCVVERWHEMRLRRVARLAQEYRNVLISQTIKPKICHLWCDFFLLVMKTLSMGSSTNASRPRWRIFSAVFWALSPLFFSGLSKKTFKSLILQHSIWKMFKR